MKAKLEEYRKLDLHDLPGRERSLREILELYRQHEEAGRELSIVQRELQEVEDAVHSAMSRDGLAALDSYLGLKPYERFMVAIGQLGVSLRGHLPEFMQKCTSLPASGMAMTALVLATRLQSAFSDDLMASVAQKIRSDLRAEASARGLRCAESRLYATAAAYLLYAWTLDRSKGDLTSAIVDNVKR